MDITLLQIFNMTSNQLLCMRADLCALVSDVNTNGTSPSLAADVANFLGVECEMTVCFAITEPFSRYISRVLEYELVYMRC